MRIISQNGTIDVPYEMSAIRNNDGLIILCMVGETGKGSVIATYSTSEKAQKAMEMLRDAYLSRMELDGGYDTVHGCYIQPNYWVLPKVFQFPKDEDVEV